MESFNYNLTTNLGRNQIRQFIFLNLNEPLNLKQPLIGFRPVQRTPLEKLIVRFTELEENHRN